MKNFSRGIVLAVLLFVLGFALAAPAQGADRFAAVAVSTSNGQSGYGTNYPTKAAAIARAKRECGRRDAKAFWCKNAWIALAISDRKPGGFGWAWAPTQAEASANALRNCIKYNGDGRVTVCVSAYAD